MADRPELIAYHGWGFDRTFWKGWEALLPDEIAVCLFDRGYFGTPEACEFSQRSRLNILFAHSYGLHLCSAQQLAASDLLVIFGGFREFHPRAAQFRRRSRLVLQQMVNKFSGEPWEVLHSFWENTWRPQEFPGSDIEEKDGEKLLNDLQDLGRSVLDTDLLKKADKICILHGADDAIVPKRKGRELYDLFQQKASYFEVKDAGHALPYTHREQCWTFLEPELKKMLNRKEH